MKITTITKEYILERIRLVGAGDAAACSSPSSHTLYSLPKLRKPLFIKSLNDILFDLFLTEFFEVFLVCDNQFTTLIIYILWKLCHIFL